jgi:hypothetical protein
MGERTALIPSSGPGGSHPRLRVGLLSLGTAAASLALAALAFATPPAETEPDVDRLLRRMDELYESSGTRSQMDISVVKPRKTRILRLRAWTKGEDKALMIVDAPARDAGTATLKVDDNLWNYLPKISRTIRVPASMMI